MKQDAISINIGQYMACGQGEVLKTLLGSCVSACLFDPVARVGGMNHILLPKAANMEKFDANARYGIHAMEMLINDMLKMGARRNRLKAKAFGGGNVLATAGKTISPGERNVEFVLEFLRLENIPVMAKDFGGAFTRVLYFHTDTFEVFVKKTGPKLGKQTIEAEEKYQRKVPDPPDTSGDIILFD